MSQFADTTATTHLLNLLIITIPHSMQHIQKLTHQNFAQWRSHLLALFNGLDIQGYVNVDIIEPEHTSPTYKNWFK